jgi:two-component system, LytTR family, sensor histidine kinase AlgZ
VFRFGVGVALFFGLAVIIYEAVHRRLTLAELELRTRQLEEERANRLLAQARLAALEARIHPHFLFNTLNSISALIPGSPQRAEVLVGRLASLLRFTLHAAQSSLVPLRQEVQIVRDYLEIEQARFAGRLRYRIDVPEELGEEQVPPMCVQLLVENSVKYAVAPRPEGAEIIVSAVARDDTLDIAVTDDGAGFSLDQAQPGHAIRSLIERLQILFGEEGRLRVERERSRTVVRVVIPLASVSGEADAEREVSGIPGGR